MVAFGIRRKSLKTTKELEESQENERMDVATGVNKKKTISRPIHEARDHMKLKYHSVGSFNHKPYVVRVRRGNFSSNNLFQLRISKVFFFSIKVKVTMK